MLDYTGKKRITIQILAYLENIKVEVLKLVGIVFMISPYGETINDGAPLILLISGRRSCAAATEAEDFSIAQAIGLS
jgi:hypothetical protein